MLFRHLHSGAILAVMTLAACGESDTSPSETSSSGPGGGGGGQGGGAGQGGEGIMDIAAICDAYCECVSCSEVSRNGCPGFWESTQMSAESQACVPPYDALVDCLLSTATCNAGMTSDQCDDERMVLDACMN